MDDMRYTANDDIVKIFTRISTEEFEHFNSLIEPKKNTLAITLYERDL